MPVRYAGNDNRITYGKTPIKSIMQGETAIYGVNIIDDLSLFTYVETESEIQITGLTSIGSKIKNIRVPSVYNEKPVTLISDTAFNNATNIEALVIPDSIKGIGEGALSGCSSLKSITIPFSGCGTATDAIGVEGEAFGMIFGGNSYSGGQQITQYYGGSSNQYNVYYIPSSLVSVHMTQGYLGYGTFYGCRMLEEITFTNHVPHVGISAFRNCSGLQQIVVPEGVKRIENRAFMGCSNLEYVYLPSTLTEIGTEMFNNCSKLSSINFGGARHAWYDLDDAQGNWKGNAPITQVVCSDGTVSV